MEIKIKKLKRFNIIMGTVHLIQGGLLFWLGTVVNSDFVVPITLTQLVGVGSVSYTHLTLPTIFAV